MDHGGGETRRLVGDYVIESRLGFGSFAVVWRAQHRYTGVQFAIKEIDKKDLNENLLKEISILRSITHPNIIRLFDAIETEHRIYLVLEYCKGGDLWAYINRYGRVSEDVARHFMRQLAAGLQALRDNHLIHRDLKPQNLLLSSKEETPSLKIGDFGFARYLTEENLAATLCGSPLYMAPEIIQNQKYNAKADLWSVGGILFQLVTGKPPFEGNNQLQLFQNVLSSTELWFPEGALEILHPDCIDLCRRLLRRDPVERLTFEEFFNHQFLVGPRVTSDSTSAVASQLESMHLGRDDQKPQSSHGNELPAHKNPNLASSFAAADSLESIEGEYVLVPSQFASMETLVPSLEPSLQDSSTSIACPLPPSASGPSTSSSPPCVLGDAEGISELHPSIRLPRLRQYIDALSGLAQEKFNAGFIVESFSVELVVLAIWKEAFEICSSWPSSGEGTNMTESLSNLETSRPDRASSSSVAETVADLTNPSSAIQWVAQGFFAACDLAEKLSEYIRDTGGNAQMPDSMEIIYQTALSAGRNGAADEYIGNRDSAATLYSQAVLLFSFIALEAPLLPRKPPFILPDADKHRIQRYIRALQSQLMHLRRQVRD